MPYDYVTGEWYDDDTDIDSSGDNDAGTVPSGPGAGLDNEPIGTSGPGLQVGVRTGDAETGYQTLNKDGSITYQDPDGNVYTKTPTGNYITESGGIKWEYNPTTGAFTSLGSSVADSGISALVNSVKSFFQKKDTKGNPIPGEYDWAKIAGFGAGAAGILGAGTPTGGGWQGTIPKYTASREQIKYDDPNRRPGAQGRQYFTDVNYSGASTAPQAQGILAAYQAAQPPVDKWGAGAAKPALAMPWVKKAADTASTTTASTAIPAMLTLKEKLAAIRQAAPTPATNTSPPPTQTPSGSLGDTPEDSRVVNNWRGEEEVWGKLDGLDRPLPAIDTSPDAFRRSQAYQDFEKSQEGSIGTMDMYESPHFGMQNSGSYGRALDNAYESWLNNQRSTSPPPTQTPSGSLGDTPEDFGYTDEEFKKFLATQPSRPPEYGMPYMPTMGGNLEYTPEQRQQYETELAQKAAANPGGANVAQQATRTVEAAMGGIMPMARGRYLQGPTDGMADKIDTSIDGRQPAKLSHGEFVVPADVVSHLGNGNSDAGAKKLYSMMDKVRQARTGTKKQGKQINPDKYMPGGTVNKYAKGGIANLPVKKFDTGGTTKLPATDTTTSSTLSPWVGDYVADYLGKGQALADAPYQAYTGPLTADASDLQKQAFAGASNLASTGYDPTAFTTGTFNTAAANQYMNPYLQAALDPQLAELQRRSQINLQPDLAKLTQAGGFGGGRQAIMQSEAARNLLAEQNKTVGQGYATAYDKAMQQFNADQARQMEAQKASEQSRQYGADYGIKSLQELEKAGATERGITAEGIAADKAQWEEQREWPYKMVQYQQGLLQGLPISTQTNTQNMSALTSLLSSLGYGGQLTELLNSFGQPKTTTTTSGTTGTTGTTNTTGTTSAGTTQP